MPRRLAPLLLLLAACSEPSSSLTAPTDRFAFPAALGLVARKDPADGKGATALLVAPVSLHRVLFRRRLKPQLVTAADVFARGGLVVLAHGCLLGSPHTLGPGERVAGQDRPACRGWGRHRGAWHGGVQGSRGLGCGLQVHPF